MGIWKSILYCWVTLYTGLVRKFIVDQDSQFQKTFAELAELHDITVGNTGSESHNSMGIGERYHAPLCNTYLRSRHEHSDVDGDLILALFTKVICDTLGLEGALPSALVFGALPSLRSHLGANIPRATLAERAMIAQEARRLMICHLVSAMINTALKRRTPAAADHVYRRGDLVSLWRKKQIENFKGSLLAHIQ